MSEPLTAGVDEAGRGPLAGPVVVAAVILDPARPIPGLADSKTLSAARREALDAQIRERALAFSVIEIGVADIDRLNILQATLLGMARACTVLERDCEVDTIVLMSALTVVAAQEHDRKRIAAE